MEVNSPPAHPQLTLDDYQRVRRIVNTILGPAFDRDNIAADVVLNCWIKGDTRPSYKLIRWRCLDAARKFAQSRTVDIDASTHPPDTTPHDNKADLINRLTALLDTTERQVIAYKYWLGMTTAEAARRLGVAETVVELTLQRALHKMREGGNE